MNTLNRILYIGSHQQAFKDAMQTSGFSDESFQIDVAQDTETLAKLVSANPYASVIYDVEPENPLKPKEAETPSIDDICCALDGIKSAEAYGGHSLAVFMNSNSVFDRDLAGCIQAQGGFSMSVEEYARKITTSDGVKAVTVDYGELAAQMRKHFSDVLESMATKGYYFSVGRGMVNLKEIQRASGDLGLQQALELMVTQIGGPTSTLKSASVDWPVNRTPRPENDPWCTVNVYLDGAQGSKVSLIIPGATDNRGYTQIHHFKPYGEILAAIYSKGCHSCANATELTGFRDRLARYNII